MSPEASVGAMAKIKLPTPVGDRTLTVLSNVTQSATLPGSHVHEKWNKYGQFDQYILRKATTLIVY